MSDVNFRRHRVFRETPDVIFYDISVEESNAQDLVVHTNAAISPPNDMVGAKQFYIHRYQQDHNRVLSGERTFELVNYNWKCPYHIVHLNIYSGALVIPRETFHRSVSGESGSIVINQAERFEGFNADQEFIPVSTAEDPDLYKILKYEKQILDEKRKKEEKLAEEKRKEEERLAEEKRKEEEKKLLSTFKKYNAKTQFQKDFVRSILSIPNIEITRPKRNIFCIKF